MAKSYIILALFGICLIVFILVQFKRKESGLARVLPAASLPWFVAFFTAGIATIALIIWLLDGHEISAQWWTIVSALAFLTIGTISYYGTRKLESRARNKVRRQMWIVAVVFCFTLALYWALVIGIDPVAITILSLVFNVAAANFLHRSW